MEGELWQLEAQWFCIEKFFVKNHWHHWPWFIPRYSPEVLDMVPALQQKRQSQVNKNAMIQRQR